MVSLISFSLFVYMACDTQKSTIQNVNHKEISSISSTNTNIPSEDERVPTEGDEDENCPDYITYQTVGKPFMTTWCTPCHNSNLAEDERAGAYTYANFDDYEQVLSHSDRILARIQDTAYPMPPAGGIPEETIQRMMTWLECGMLE
jgi:hypothetical protein